MAGISAPPRTAGQWRSRAPRTSQGQRGPGRPGLRPPDGSARRPTRSWVGVPLERAPEAASGDNSLWM